MVTRAHNFRHSDIKRAFRAAEAAGVKNPTIRVVCRNGTELHIGGSVGGEPEVASSKPKRASSRRLAR
jgi:hypothetical protein